MAGGHQDDFAEDSGDSWGGGRERAQWTKVSKQESGCCLKWKQWALGEWEEF